MIDRQLIRKQVLLEMHRRITLLEQAGVDMDEVLSIEAFDSEEAKQEIISQLEAFIDDLKAPLVTISETQSSEFAKRIYDATKGRFGGLGVGTDEEAIKEIIQEIPTIIDVSFVSEKFEKQYKGSWTFTPTLKAVFSDELNDTDMEIYVNTIINDKMKTAFIKLPGTTAPMGYDEFFEYISAGENIKSQFAGEETGGMMASSGLLTAMQALTSDDEEMGVGIHQVPAQAVAGAAGVYAGTKIVGTSANPIAATSRVAQGMGTAKAVGERAFEKSMTKAKPGIKKAGKKAGKAAAKGVSAKDIKAVKKAQGVSKKKAGKIARKTARKAAKKAAKASARQAAKRAALKAGGMALLKTAPRIAMRAVPVVGWALLAVELVDWAMSADISANTDLALDSTLYSRTEDFLKQGIPAIEGHIDQIKAIPVIEEVEVEEGEEGEGTEYPGLGWGLDEDYIANIIRTMMAYKKTRELSDMPSASGTEWKIPETQDAWEFFAAHALENCSIFGDYTGLVNVSGSWPRLSRAMKGDFPGYTNNPKGCLAFCLDAYYDQVRFGNTMGGGSPGVEDDDLETKEDTAPPPGERKTGRAKIQIRLDTGGKNFTDSGFTFANGANVDANIKENLLNLLNTRARNNGIRATNMTFYAKVNNAGKVVAMDRMRFDGSGKDWKKRPARINQAIKTIFDDGALQIPDGFDFNQGPKGRGGKTINFTVRFSGGAY